MREYRFHQRRHEFANFQKGKIAKATGARICRVRQAANLLQKTVAAVIGVSTGTLARWERNGISPLHPKLPLIIDALECYSEHITGIASRGWVVDEEYSPDGRLLRLEAHGRWATRRELAQHPVFWREGEWQPMMETTAPP